MSKPSTILTLLAALSVVACSTQAQLLDSRQTDGVQTAVRRGQSELNCPEVKPTLMSREVVQPPGYDAPAMLTGAEYTISVQGCGREQTYFIICPEGGAECYPAAPGTFVGR
jgi:hypothetical protein